MKNQSFSYIRINTEEGFVKTSRITWNEFYHGINPKPRNILSLDGCPWDAPRCKLNLQYIPSEQMTTFVESDVYDYGDFCWVDFDDPARLSSVPDGELAELLFFRHQWRPLKSHKIPSLQNRYAYISHDDGWITRVYMERPEEYKQVIEYKILKELKGRKRTIQPISTEIMDTLFAVFQKGAALDFENSFNSGVHVSVHVYPLGDVDYMDDIHRLLDQQRLQLYGISLGYNANTKNWNIYDYRMRAK